MLIVRKQRSAGQRKRAFAMKPYWNKYDRLKLLSLSGASAFHISMRGIFKPEFQMDSLRMNEKLLQPQSLFGHSSHSRKYACVIALDTKYQIRQPFILKRDGTILFSKQNVSQKINLLGFK